jgi:hypothetical protein
MTCIQPEPDESGERCIRCGQEIGDWGDNGMWVHVETGSSARSKDFLSKEEL